MATTLYSIQEVFWENMRIFWRVLGKKLTKVETYYVYMKDIKNVCYKLLIDISYF
jgi:hypothetical protein